jgi:heptosyltransferase-3
MEGNILISRTDSIGDVILTLPMAGIIKEKYPNSKIYFLGNDYTKAIIEKCEFVNHFVNIKDTSVQSFKNLKLKAAIHVFPNKEVAQMVKNAAVPLRIGTSHRWYHWFTCNKTVDFTRKKSDLHEAQLNLKLLSPLGINNTFSLEEIAKYANWPLVNQVFPHIVKGKFNLILHMKSKGSAAEWPVKMFMEMAKGLSPDLYNILISGTEDEGKRIKDECLEIFDLEHVTDVTGQFSLSNFINFVGSCDGLLACSTGPLHIAASSGINALGLYPDKKPMNAGRWAPIGKKVQYIESDIIENSGKQVLNILPENVLDVISKWN